MNSSHRAVRTFFCAAAAFALCLATVPAAFAAGAARTAGSGSAEGPVSANQPAGGSRYADDSLYRAFGEKTGLVKLTGDLVDRLVADPRTAAQFEDIDAPRLKSELATQLCALAGGPCRYAGKDMKTVHEGLGIRKSDFNAMVEILQETMTAHDVSFAAQNRMLALLAPMHRDIIEK